MMQEALKRIDFTVMSEIAMAMFAVVFVVVTIRTLLNSKTEIDSAASIPLSDKPVTK